MSVAGFREPGAWVESEGLGGLQKGLSQDPELSSWGAQLVRARE